MSQQNLEIIIPVISLIAAVIITFFSIQHIKKNKKSLAFEQRALFRRFLISLGLYYASGFLGGIFFFHSSPLSSLARVAAFIDIPLYAILFLLLAIFYIMAMLFNGLPRKKRQEYYEEEEEKPGFFARVSRFFIHHPRFSYLLLYTLLFFIIFGGVFSVLLLKSKGFIWRTDGKPQYAPYLSYMGDYLRELIDRLSHGDYTIRMYDFSIGMGEDVRSVFRIHPTDFLSVFFQQEQLEDLYNILVVLRYYLSGLAFTLYCRHKKISWQNTLVASFTYVFSGYGIQMAVKHPSFHAPVIFLPLLLIGLDRLIEKKGYLLFSFMVAISMSTSYYFLYMTTIALGFYALVHFGKIYKEHRVKEFFKMMGRIIFFYLLGIGMSGAAFLPTVIRALTSERVGTVKTIFDDLLSYGDLHFVKVFLSTIAGKYSGYDIHLSFAVIFLPALTVLFVRNWKEHLGLKIIIILEAIAVCLPAFGLAMSAFTTVSNRWIYVLAMTGAYTIACVMDDFRRLTIIQSIAICVVTALYGAAWFYMRSQTKYSLELEVAFRLLIFTTVILLVISFIKHVTRPQLTAILCILTAVSLSFHGIYLMGNETDPLADDFLVSHDEMAQYFNKEEFSRLGEIDDDSFYRCDAATMRDYYENASCVFDYQGTSIYNSVINSNLVNYHVDLASIGISAVHRIYSFDGRTVPEALASVKYYQIAAGKNRCVPYGFKKSEELSNEEFWVYENQYPLSIGYTYDSWITQSDYEKLSPLEKQQVMLHSAVLDKKESGQKSPAKKPNTGNISESTPTIIRIDDKLNEEDNYFETIKTEDNVGLIAKYKMSSEDDLGGFSISFEKKAGCETYLYLEDFTTSLQRAKIYLTSERLDKFLIARNDDGTYSLGRDDYYVNLGYSQKSGRETIRFDFANSGEYSIKNIKICYVPMNTYEQDIQNLAEESLTDVVIDTNTVSGTVTLSKDKIMVFSIPYSSGWTAYVDGKKTSLFKANTAYMGLSLKEGSHDIRLVYETPGLKIGAAISSVCILLFLLLGIIFGIRRLFLKTKKEPLPEETDLTSPAAAEKTAAQK